MWIFSLIILLIKMAIVLGGLLGLAAYLILLERKLLGRFQIRLGPNRAGPFGILQPIADGIKIILKEDIVPPAADKWIFLLGPGVVAGAAMLIFAVVPFAQGWHLFGHEIPGVISDFNVGLLYVLALSSISVYGVALGAWASNSKYSLIGGFGAPPR